MGILKIEGPLYINFQQTIDCFFLFIIIYPIILWIQTCEFLLQETMTVLEYMYVILCNNIQPVYCLCRYKISLGHVRYKNYSNQRPTGLDTLLDELTFCQMKPICTYYDYKFQISICFVLQSAFFHILHI